MIQVIEKNEGTKLDYEVVGSKLFLGDDEIMMNLAKYEKDEPVHIDVVRTWDGALATSIGKNNDELSYAAQIDIPARAYTEKSPCRGWRGRDGADHQGAGEVRYFPLPPDPVGNRLSERSKKL